MKFDRLNSFLSELMEQGQIPALSVAVGQGRELLFSHTYGTIYESGLPANSQTLFDVASLTKIPAGICFMQLVEEGKLRLSDPIANLFPEMAGRKPVEKDGQIIAWIDGGSVTWYQALTHTSGMGFARKKTRPSLPGLEAGLDKIFRLPFVCMPNEHVIYADIPIILMGKAIELITNQPLDQVVYDRVCSPLSMKQTRYLRRSEGPYSVENIAPTEYDSIFRKERVWGAVHDENAFLMDGVAGHAGIFSTAEDMCRLALAYSACFSLNGLLKQETVMHMTRQCVEEDGDRRGLIWQLSGRSDTSYTRFLSERAYGHAGFTGCFLWSDPERDMSVVLLSNDIYQGRDHRTLFASRPSIMRLVVEGLSSA